MKIYTLFGAMLIAAASNAQVNITLKVDITDYLAAGNTLGANGIRVGGNFATNGATVGGNAMADWTPSDPNSALTQEGTSNVWSITITFPSSAAGSTQLFKFVNNDWGTNEGTDTNLIVTGGCGVDDGSGNINRTLIIPADTSQTYSFCWDRCTQCNGEPAGVMPLTEIKALQVFPNPANSNTNLTFELTTASNTQVELFNAIGQRVLTNNMGLLQPGKYNQLLDLILIDNGIYILKVNSGEYSKTTRISLVK